MHLKIMQNICILLAAAMKAECNRNVNSGSGKFLSGGRNKQSIIVIKIKIYNLTSVINYKQDQYFFTAEYFHNYYLT